MFYDSSNAFFVTGSYCQVLKANDSIGNSLYIACLKETSLANYFYRSIPFLSLGFLRPSFSSNLDLIDLNKWMTNKLPEYVKL